MTCCESLLDLRQERERKHCVMRGVEKEGILRSLYGEVGNATHQKLYVDLSFIWGGVEIYSSAAVVTSRIYCGTFSPVVSNAKTQALKQEAHDSLYEQIFAESSFIRAQLLPSSAVVYTRNVPGTHFWPTVPGTKF